MTARYRIAHTSRYEYDRSVVASYNEARVTPLQTLWQTRLESGIAIDPVSWNHRYVDYWGTDVRMFEANMAHRALEVRATSLVEVDASRRPLAPGVDWDALREPAMCDEMVEYLTQTDATLPPAELSDLADSIAADCSPAETVTRLATAVHDALEYRSGVTEVHTVATEAWAARSGVCQDFTHLLVGALRHVAVPARYVSGYLYPNDEPQIGDSAEGESHAWVECWLGDWSPVDPTNLSDVADRHVMVGTGRDYGDVPPIKGIVAGAHNTVAMDIRVEFTRLA